MQWPPNDQPNESRPQDISEHGRIFRKIKQDLSKTQFGFWNAMGTRRRCLHGRQPSWL